MTFELIETSLSSGRPVRLYLFQRGTLRWAYCTGQLPITWETVTYQPIQISDNGGRQSGEADADVFEVIAPASLEVAQLYRGLPPSGEIFLTVRDLHYDLDDDVVALVAWIGSIYSVKWPALDRCKIICNSMAASMTTAGLRLSWSRNCTHVLYGRGCSLNKQDFEEAGTVTGVSGRAITVLEAADFEDGFFTGGFIEWLLEGGVVDMRTIENHVGDQLVMLGAATGLAAGLNLKLYPGCPRTIAVCSSRFNNGPNYGGVPGQPGKSPFDGDPIF